MGLTQWRSPTFISIQLRWSERKELVIICDLPLCWETEAEDEPPELRQHAEKERLDLVAAALWERQHVLEGLWATGFIPPRACLSQYGGGWLLNGSTWPYASPLSRSDFTGLPSQHPPAVLYAAPPPHSLPLPIPYPQSDPSSWILSEWHPLNLPNYLSSSHAAVALSRQHILLTGRSWGAKSSSTGLPDSHLEGRTLCDTINPSLSSSKLWATLRS